MYRYQLIHSAKAIFLLLVSLASMGGSGSVLAQVAVSDDADSAAKQFRVSEGTSSIYIFHGPWTTCGIFGCIDQKLNFPFGFSSVRLKRE